jgi:hypothetical protein
MRRALVTFATGEHERLLEVALPTMRRYADRHGYDLLADPPPPIRRPPSWLKIPLLQKALRSYDEVLWLDADLVVVDDRVDVADEIDVDSYHAMVRHHTADGEVPSCGVWLLRKPMLGWLARAWVKTEYLDHGWWEQAALLDLLGYEHRTRPCRHVRETSLYRHTHWLELEWNSHEQSDRHPDPRFAHATAGGLAWRLEVMRRYAALTPATGGAR